MRRPLALASLALTLWPAEARAVQKPSPRDRVRPDFDSRWGQRAPSPQVDLAAQGRVDLLRDRLHSPLRTRVHALTGSGRLLWAGGEPLSEAGGDPLQSTRRFLRENAAILGLAPEADATLVPSAARPLLRGALRRVRLEQVVDGLPVFGGQVAVHLDREGRVVKVMAGPLHPGREEAASSSPSLTAEEALDRAVRDLRPEMHLTPKRRSGAKDARRGIVFDAGPLRAEPTVDLVWFPTAGGPRLAWKATVDPGGFPQVYDVLVDAANGDLLYRRNRVRYAQGVGTVPQSDETQAEDPRRPDEHPLGSDPSGPGDPPGGCPPPTGYETRSLDAPFRDPATVLTSGGRLRGNNTAVYRRTAPTFGALGTLDAGTWRFEFPFGSASSVETALFFSVNFAHDFFYDLGFDEAAGNFQVDNFGRGGLGGDPLTTLARASGRNNATFEPTPEGQSPIMSLFLFDGTGCWADDVDGDGSSDLDGGYDTDVVIHEYHHGVSLRLNPDFTGPEADAMGEGGGDFFAYSLSGNTQLAEYSVPPFGIRGVNTKTYADWTCLFFFYCEPHDNGEIWANVLWDLREQFRSDLVGGSEAAAIDETHHLYVDGLALSPPSPTMLDLRDAMLEADLLRNPDSYPGGSANHCRIWNVFAARGLGQGALDTQDTGDNSVVANDLVPDVCPQTPKVSLAVSDLQAAEAGLDPGAFRVSRTASVASDLTVAYTVSGTATPGSDYVALAGSVVIPAGSATATLPVSPLDDPQYEALETVIVTLLPDAAYLIQGSASGTVRITSDDAGPDLVVSALTAPAASGAGHTVAVTDTTRNQGAGAAAASTTSFYLSTNTVFDAADVFLGSRAVPELAGSAASPSTTSLTIPVGTTAGTHYVLARSDAEAAVFETNEANNNRVAPVAVGPDLVVSTFSAPAASGPGLGVTVTDTTRNQGAGTAPASTTSFYLSPNSVFDAADVFLGARAVPELSANGTSTADTALVVPLGTPAGAYYLIARADGGVLVSETSETNNTRLAPLTVGPDLVVSAFTAPAASGPGLAVSVSDTTRNQGAGSAPASTTSFYLSSNATYDAADTLLGSRAVPELATNAVSTLTTSVTIPAATTAGAYYLIARADGGGLVPETTETNNTRVAAVTVGPDLVVSVFTAPTASGPGLAVSVSDTTRNQGAGSAPASTTSFYLSTNATYDPTDTFLASRAVPELAANGSSVVATFLTIPAGTPAGTYYLIARADADALVPETGETNNTRSAALAVGPDLVVSAFTAPAASGAGLAVTVTDTTRNQGAGSAPASTTSFYLSANAVYDAADTFLGSRAVPELSANGTSTLASSLTIPAGTTAGTYYLIARADGDALVPETGETNNTRSAALAVGPDLVVSVFTAPAASGPGLSLSVSDTTRNQGAGSAAASTTSFYLSTNATFDAADVFLGSRAVPELGANGTSTLATSLTIPAGTTAGTYYLIARADADTLVPETGEGNNTRIDPITISAP